MCCLGKDGLVHHTMTPNYLNEQPKQMAQNGNENVQIALVCSRAPII